MIGTFPLQAGPRRLSFMIVGKAQQSSGYYVGVDVLEAYPVSQP